MNCEALLAAIAALNAQTGDTYQCHAEGTHIAVARDADDAARFAATMQTAETSFQQRFGHTPPPSATIQGNQATNALREAARTAGFNTILPWIDNAEQAALLRDQVARQIASQTPGLPAAQQSAMVEQALAGRLPEPLAPNTENSAIAHEFGHMWFIRTYWDGETRAHTHYGGEAPDWLDELAAVALENEAMTEDRRSEVEAWIEAGERPDLGAFLAIEHPLAQLASAVAERRETGGGGLQAIQLSGEEADELMSQASFSPGDYYVLSRSMLDYFDARCGEAPLDDLTRTIAGGASFEDWLGAQTGCDALPRSVDALEADWAARLRV